MKDQVKNKGQNQRKNKARERTKKNNDRDKISWDNAIVKLHSEVHFGK